MPSLNKVFLVGHLGRDPEMKMTKTGKNVCKFSIATTKYRNDPDGGKQKDTTWHNIVVWGKTCEFVNNYLKKGHLVHIEGQIDNRSWDKDDGTKGYASEVIAFSVLNLTPKPDNASSEVNKDQEDMPF